MNNLSMISNLKKIYPEIHPDFNFGLICILQDVIERLGAQIDIEEDKVKIVTKNNKIIYSPKYILDYATKEYNDKLET